MTSQSPPPGARSMQATGLDEREGGANLDGLVQGSSPRLILVDYPPHPFALFGDRMQRHSFAISDQQGHRHMPRQPPVRPMLAMCPMVAAGCHRTISRTASHSSSETKTPSKIAAATRKRSWGLEAEPSRSWRPLHRRVVSIAGILGVSNYGSVKTVEQRSAAQLNRKMLESRGESFPRRSTSVHGREMLT